MTLLIGMIILTILTAGVIVVADDYLNESYKSQGKRNKKAGVIKYTPVSLIWLLFILFGCFATIGANEVGVVFNSMNGGIQDETLPEGFQTKSIFSKVTKISTANRSIELETTGQTKDSIYATFELTIVYKIDTVDAGKFYKVSSSNDISSSQINSIVKESLQYATTQVDIYSVMGSELETVRYSFEDTLRERLYERYFVTLVSASFDDIDAGSEIESVIKQKAEALQQIEIANANAEAALIAANAEAAVKMIELENQLAMAEASANNDILLAEIQKEIAVLEAQIIKIEADADAYKTEAEKTALANSIKALYDLHNTFDNDGLLIKENVTYQECYDMIVTSMFYDSWNGELPLYVSDGSLSLLLPIE
ncbi:MAG: SPFH domain-containing protein [bacterium]